MEQLGTWLGASALLGALLAVLWVVFWSITVPQVLPWAVWEGYNSFTPFVGVLGFAGGVVSPLAFKS